MELGVARPFLKDVVKEMLNCGKEAGGFAVYKCEDCGEEVRVPFSCLPVGRQVRRGFVINVVLR
ncbi:MAG: hypothetical protein COX49_04775 [bacterium (Candidatus Stahlbacteria) CG23_combo_of_CG06-09_8_20_14_all_40_9]|nr:MAG: hypothetical protein COX49_04775 [bacterium (Candidatus Stahlbacteria) CG23_combo_of_CG06-09_8_20_14_all_40_9]